MPDDTLFDFESSQWGQDKITPKDFKDHAYLGKKQTSRDAAKSILPKTGTQRARVFDYIVSRETFGATDEEICQALEMNPSSVRPRRLELLEANLIELSPQRRLTSSGQKAIVWIKGE